MLYEAISGDEEEELGSEDNTKIDHKLMSTMAIATSIDAMAAGFTLNLLAVNAWIACLIIAVVTALFSFGAVYLESSIRHLAGKIKQRYWAGWY